MHKKSTKTIEFYQDFSLIFSHKMKQKLFPFSILIFFFIMLIFPETVFLGASKGLVLWFQTVLPTLLPFIILSNLLINTIAIDWICNLVSPVLCRFFRVSKHGAFAVLCGFLCGYPLGSKITSDLFQHKYISKSEAYYLLSFCNNVSPIFIISYIVIQNLKSSDLIIPTILIMLAGPIMCSFIFKHFHTFDRLARQPQSRSRNLSGNLVDSCIMNGFETITKVGGYIMLFSIFIEVINNTGFCNNLISYFLLSSLEITNGISMLANCSLKFDEKYILVLTLASFGGWCSIAQTQSMIQGSKINILPYIIEKLITALVTSLLAYIFISLY